MKPPSATDRRRRGACAGYFASLARYHAWATARLYEHIDRLSEADYRKDGGLFFKSVHGTCNHLLVAEHSRLVSALRRGRLEPDRLDTELEPRPRRAARAPARRGAALAGADRVVRRRALRRHARLHDDAGVAQSLPFAPTLGHVFNHATHHRGQITAAITAMGYPCPEIDWVWMLQAESRGPSAR